MVAGGVGYFTAITPDTGRELWRTDGTERNTTRMEERCD
jgi:ELWxxDGT repeat protein